MTTKQAAAAVAAALGTTLQEHELAGLEGDAPAAPPATQDPPAGSSTPPTDPPQDPPAGTPPTDPPAGETKPGAKPADDGTPPGDPNAPLDPKKLAELLDGKPAGEADAGKTGDPVLDEPIPADVKDRTRERMEQLLTRGRESHEKIQTLTAELEDVRALAVQGDQLTQAIHKTGMAPEEFGTIMGAFTALNIGTPEQQRGAFEHLTKLYNAMAAKLGVDTGAAALADFPDLERQVAELQLPRSTALELAAARRREAEAAQHRTRESQEQRQERELLEARDAAVARLDQVGGQLLARDGNDAFQIRKHIAMRALQSQVRTMHPSRWEAAFIDAYQAVPAVVVESTIASLRGNAGGAPAARRTTPLMGGGGGGNGGSGGNGGNPTPQAKTTQDVVFGVLGLTPGA